MAKTNVAVFAQTPLTASAVLTQATTLTGVGSISDVNNSVGNTVALITAGTDGAILTKCTVLPRGTTTASIVYLFIQEAERPATERILIDSVILPASTYTTTSMATKTTFNITEGSPLRLGAGDQLFVSLSTAQAVGVSVYAEYTNF